MRFIWTLVIACLVAAGGVRPEQELQRNPDAAKLSRDHAALAVIGNRRDHSAKRELGVGVAITLPEPPAIIPPRAYALVTSRTEYVAPIAALVSPRSSRGPPIA